LPRKKDNIVSLAKKTNDASKYSTQDLLKEILDSEVPKELKKCICILSNEEFFDEGVSHKFNYYVAGYRSRLELLGVLEYIRRIILDELSE